MAFLSSSGCQVSETSGLQLPLLCCSNTAVKSRMHMQYGWRYVQYRWRYVSSLAKSPKIHCESSWRKVAWSPSTFHVTNMQHSVNLLIRSATMEDVEAEKELIEDDAVERMEKTLETVQKNFNTVRTGRASPSLLDRVEVEYYGSPVILKSIAQVSTPDGSTLLIQPFDKSSLSAIEKAISKSDLGLTPSNDGVVIRLSIPQLTEERRKDMLKLVAKLAEEGKIAIRNVRRDAIKSYEKLEKDKKLSADNVKDLSSDIQKITADYVKKIDGLFKQKEKDLTTV